MRCHEAANSPRFDDAKYRPYIVGPGHGQPLAKGQEPRPKPGSVHANAGGALFAANALPECVVAIENDHLTRRAAQCKQASRQHGCHGAEILGSVGNVAQAVRVFVFIIADWIVLERLPAGDDVEACDRGQLLSQGGFCPV